MSAVAVSQFDYEEGWTNWDDMKRYGPMSRHTRRLIWGMVSDLPFNSVLDVGCGQGSPLEEIARHRPEVELAGVDLSSHAIALARRRLPVATFHTLDLTKTSLDRRFDLVICSDVLEHIPDDVAALRNMARMARRWCLVTTLQGRMRDFEATVGHVRNYHRGEVRAKMEGAGFKVRREIEWGFPFYSPLYRDICNQAPPSATSGVFGFRRRLLSSLLYHVFLANSSRRGDYVLCLGEVQ
ncbi:MAG: class I SAM-dependent methyltransferase [Chloroflexota bacterium]